MNRRDNHAACPNGHRAGRIPLVFGYPSTELMADASAGRVALGGCVVIGDHSPWACSECREPLARMGSGMGSGDGAKRDERRF